MRRRGAAVGVLPLYRLCTAPVPQVTDTTTFTSEKRRQQEDSWLYETCTRCLQHLIDIFVQVRQDWAGPPCKGLWAG